MPCSLKPLCILWVVCGGAWKREGTLFLPDSFSENGLPPHFSKSLGSSDRWDDPIDGRSVDQFLSLRGLGVLTWPTGPTVMAANKFYLCISSLQKYWSVTVPLVVSSCSFAASWRICTVSLRRKSNPFLYPVLLFSFLLILKLKLL